MATRTEETDDRRPKKKPSKVMLTPSTVGTQRADEAGLGGLGTGGTSSAKPKKLLQWRGTSTAPEK